MSKHCFGWSTKKFCITAVKNTGLSFLQDSCTRSICRPLSVEEHVDQQLQQISLAYHGPEEEFRDEAGCDALQHGGCEQDLGKSLLVPWVKELDQLAEGVLSFLLQAFNKQHRL